MQATALAADVATTQAAKPDLMERQFSALLNAPLACLTFFGIGAGAAWWFSRYTKEREISGLQAKISILEQQLKLGEQTLKEREGAIDQLRKELEEYQKKSGLSTPFLGGRFASGPTRAFDNAIKTLILLSELDDQLNTIYSPPTNPDNQDGVADVRRTVASRIDVLQTQAREQIAAFPVVQKVRAMVIHPRDRVPRNP